MYSNTKGGDFVARKKIIMNEKHVIRCAMTISGETAKTLSLKIGISATSFYNQLLRTESTMTLTSVLAALREMGFEIVVRDENGRYGGVEYVIKEIEPDSPEWMKQAAKEKGEAEVRRIECESKAASAAAAETKPKTILDLLEERKAAIAEKKAKGNQG